MYPGPERDPRDGQSLNGHTIREFCFVLFVPCFSRVRTKSTVVCLELHSFIHPSTLLSLYEYECQKLVTRHPYWTDPRTLEGPCHRDGQPMVKETSKQTNKPRDDRLPVQIGL